MVVYYIVGLLYYSSAAINPVLYNVMSRDFRRAFHRMYSCEIWRRRTSEQYVIAAGSPERSWIPFAFASHLQQSTPGSPHPDTKPRER